MTNTSRTARDSPSSRVKRSRSQSQEQPIFCSWLRMMPWCSRATFQVSSTNFSRPSASREVPRLLKLFSTTFWVAMPAWSVPGSQRVGWPSMRW